MHVVNEAPAAFRSSAHRPGALALVVTAFREAWSRRRLIRYMIGANVRKKGADTVMGNLWWVLDPLFAVLVYVLVMTVIFQRSTPDFALFLLAALVPFKWFTATVGSSAGSVAGHERIIKQIPFPKIVLPITTAGSEVVGFLFGLLVLFAVELIVYRDHLSLMLLWIPVIAAVQFVLQLGLAFFISAITVFYRDIGNIVRYFMRLLFFISPVLWSFDAALGRGRQLEEALGPAAFQLLHVNPVSTLLMSYRHVIYGTLEVDAQGEPIWSAPVPPDLWQLGLVLAIGLAVAMLGIWFFKRLEPGFAKVL